MRQSTSLKARRAASKRAPTIWRRPLLEMLEDRVVPSLADGTILVATSPSSYASTNQSSFPTAIVGINPSTGAQTIVSQGQSLLLPAYIAQDPNGQIYVADLDAFGTGAIIAIDPATGNQRPVTKGSLINGPNALVFINGFLYVATEGDGSGTVHNIIKVDPTTGAQTLISTGSGGGFTVPTGMTPAPGGNVYVADEQSSVNGPQPGQLWEVNLSTGQQTVISSNNATQGTLFNHPVDVALDANGNIIVANTGNTANNAAGSIFRVNPNTGVQTAITSFGAFSGTDSTEVGESGTIFVGVIANGNNPGAIITVNPVSGAQTTLTSGGNLSLVEGMRTYHFTASPTQTSTTVTSSTSPSVFGQSVTFTATVKAQSGSSTPTGTVQFQIDGSPFGSPVNLNSSGVATSSATNNLSVAGHTIQAVYADNATFAGSTGTFAQTVNKAGTSLAIASSANPSASGQSVTFTATISVTAPGSGAPTGTVQFLIDGSATGSPVSVSTAGGVSTATFTPASLSVGTHTIAASYSGDSNFNASTSPAFTQTVGKAGSATAVTSSVNPSVFGQGVTFTATVTPTSGSGTPTGTVQFMIDNTTFGTPVSLNSSGVATSTVVSSLSVGGHTVSASYLGDATFAASTGTLTQTVGKAGTSTTVASSANPSGSGQNVTFTATIGVTAPGAGTPTGSVVFVIDGSAGSPVNVSTTSGVTTASFSTAALSTGTHTLVANYSGDGNFASSNSATLNQTVGKAGSSTVLTSSANPSITGQSVTFTATISSTAPGTPTGTVQFMVDGSPNGSPVNVSTSAGVTTASFSTATLSVGTHTIAASYSGDSNFAASNGSLMQTVSNKPGSNTAVTSSVNPSVFGQSVTFTATVTPASGSGTPTGTVQFMVDTQNLGTPVSLNSSGVATSAAISTLSVANHTIKAVYSGDANFAGGTGTLTQTVGKASTSTVVSAAANPSVFGQSVTFTATIAVTAPGAGAPTGTVQFAVDGSNTGSPVNVSTTAGVTTASFSTAGLGVGMHIITANYSGDGNFTSSTSPAFTQTVGKASTNTTITSSANPSTSGQTVTLTATINVVAPGAGTPTGTVQFVVDGSPNGSPVNVSTTAAVTTASFSTATLPVGTHTVVASYSGDGNFLASNNTFTQTIGNKPGSSTAVTSSVNPSVFGQSVTFTATVTPSSGSGTPTGTVQFVIDGTNFGTPVNLNSSGVATSGSTSTLSVANHTVQAVYSGDATFAGGTGTLTQVVNQASTSTTVSSSANPSASGQNVTFTATISVTSPGAGTPTGTVQWQIDSTNMGSPVTVSTSGGVTTATLTTGTLSSGTHTITASYSGDGNFQAASGMLQQAVGTTVASTTTAVSSSANPQTAGQPVSWTTTVTPSTGFVNFVNFESGDFSQTASHTASGAALVTSPTLNGTYALQLQRSSSIANVEIRQSGTTYYNLPTAYYQFLFEFTSNPGEGGIVNFQDATSGFKAALHLSAADKLLFYDSTGTLRGTGTTVLSPGQVYVLSAKIGTGSSAAWEIRINGTVEMSGTNNLTANNNGSLKLGGNSPYTATYDYDDVAINSQGYPGPVPTGTVQFSVDGMPFGTPVTLSDGMATSTPTSTLSAGNHVITATYSGDSTYAASNGTLAGGQTINSPTTTIADGTILVASSPLSGQAPIGIIGVNPSTGAQTVVSAGGQFSLPETVREGPNQQLYIADYSASGTGAVIRFDPSTGQQSILATGSNINGPDALAIINGFAYVADTGGVSGVAPNLVEINLSTGQQRLVSSGGGFSTPVGLAPAPNGNIYWADETAGGGAGAIFLVNIQTGVQTILTQGHLFNHMIDIGLDASGNIISFNAGSTGSGSIVRVSSAGTQTLVSSGGNLISLDGGTVDVNHGGTIYVSSLASGTNPSRIIAVDPGTGAQRIVSSGSNLSLVAGLTVFSQTAAAAPAIRSPSNSQISPKAVASLATAGQLSAVPSANGNTNAGSSPSSASATSPAVIAAMPQVQAAPPAVGEDVGSTLAAAVSDQSTVPTAAVDSLFADWSGSLSLDR